ncbi:MAG: signal recognition particle-docking protein FtsY [Clostridia bacterium]|nr:signal recognition particle-docking protein FtsY [Clostridia bacterium]MBR3805054.1 signal recognition particle-docking protein FtsY [Clostridia bacterium]
MGLFSKLKAVLTKTRDGISKKLTELFAKNKLGEEFYEELEDILISADVSVKTTMEIVDEIRDTAIKEKCKDKEYVISLLKKELFETLDYAEKLEVKSPAVIMVVGVNGVGKTTTIGKLANKFVKEKKSVTIAAADTFRAAASDQLSVWADRAKVRIIKHSEGADASAVVFDAIGSAKAKNTDVLIIDTAGRLHVKSNLMEELKKMDRVVKREFPDANYYKLIALDATTGQNAYNQVEVFNEAIGIDGIILTKLDGTAKGGFIVSLSYELEVPVCYVGTGEKLEDIEDFDAQDFVDSMF